MDYQWNEVAVPFWKEIQELSAEHGVRVAIEMHPHNLVFNPATMKRLVELTTPEGGVNHVGAEMDPSHLFWQQGLFVAGDQRHGSDAHDSEHADPVPLCVHDPQMTGRHGPSYPGLGSPAVFAPGRREGTRRRRRVPALRALGRRAVRRVGPTSSSR